MQQLQSDIEVMFCRSAICGADFGSLMWRVWLPLDRECLLPLFDFDDSNEFGIWVSGIGFCEFNSDIDWHIRYT